MGTVPEKEKKKYRENYLTSIHSIIGSKINETIRKSISQKEETIKMREQRLALTMTELNCLCLNETAVWYGKGG